MSFGVSLRSLASIRDKYSSMQAAITFKDLSGLWSFEMTKLIFNAYFLILNLEKSFSSRRTQLSIY
jgi:hypothetical protein